MASLFPEAEIETGATLLLSRRSEGDGCLFVGGDGMVDRPIHLSPGNHAMPRERSQKVAMARELRRNQTESERALWAALRANQLGPQFRRQVVLHGWILDFFCKEKQLAVEVDGPYHMARVKEDSIRDSTLARCGIRTMRFTDEQVLDNLPSVLASIREALGADCPPPRTRKRRCSADNPAGKPIGLIIKRLLDQGWRYKEAVARARHLARQG